MILSNSLWSVASFQCYPDESKWAKPLKTFPSANGETEQNLDTLFISNSFPFPVQDDVDSLCQPIHILPALNFSESVRDASKFLTIESSFEFIPQTPSSTSAREWELRVLTSKVQHSPGFNAKTQFTHTFQHAVSGTFSVDLMIAVDSYFFLAFTCLAAEGGCTALSGELVLNHTFKLGVDRCSSGVSSCQSCLPQRGCGWCGVDTQFSGCWTGSDDGPAYDNKLPCGSQKLIGEHPDAEWRFNGTGDGACMNKPPTNHLYIILTVVILVIVVGFICLAAIVTWRRNASRKSGRYNRVGGSDVDRGGLGDESSDEEDGNRSGTEKKSRNGTGNGGGKEMETLFEYDNEFQWPEENNGNDGIESDDFES